MILEALAPLLFWLVGWACFCIILFCAVQVGKVLDKVRDRRERRQLAYDHLHNRRHHRWNLRCPLCNIHNLKPPEEEELRGWRYH